MWRSFPSPARVFSTIDEDDLVLAVAREMAGKLGVKIVRKTGDLTTVPVRDKPEPTSAPAPSNPTTPFVPAEFRSAPGTEAAGDIVLRNGTIVWPGQGTFQADISVAQGKIVSIQRSCPLGVGQDLDISGQYVLPGIIDPHVHLGIFNALETDLEIETKAALWGGVTTLGLFSLRERFLPAQARCLLSKRSRSTRRSI